MTLLQFAANTILFGAASLKKLRFSKKREDLGDEYLWGAGSSFDEDMAS